MVINNAENYVEFLMMKNLARLTIEKYSYLYDKFFAVPFDINDKDILKAHIIKFLAKYNHVPARCCVVSILEFLGIENLKIPKITTHEVYKTIPSHITEENMYELIANAYQDNSILGLIIQIIYELALRRGEVLGIGLFNFNYEVWLEDRTQPCVLTITHEIAKRKSQRKILVSSELMNNIWYYIENNAQGRDFTKEPLFLIKKKTLANRLNRIALKTEGIKQKLKIHDIRHLRTHHLSDAGFSIEELKTFLGHKNILVTEIYLKKTDTQVMNRFENFYKSEKEIRDENKKT
jgi:integrase